MDDERPRKKSRVEKSVGGDAGGPERAAAGRVTAKVMDQGGFGTCVGYAFAQALSQGLQEKYGVASDANVIAEKVKTLCPCWDGHETDRMPEEWNAEHAKPGASIEGLDREKRYNVRVEFRKIDSFQEAHEDRARALDLYMPCTIKSSRI